MGVDGLMWEENAEYGIDMTHDMTDNYITVTL